MARKELFQVLEEVNPYVVSVSTPIGNGTGFLIASSKEEKVVGIATALHLVEHSFEWEQPIRIKHYKSDTAVLLKESDRSIHWNKRRDLALIRFSREKLPLPDKPLPLMEKDKYKKEGVVLGWCGFPSVYPSKLCFFSGCISAWLDHENAYLVDGVVINGVSGGPAFDCFSNIVGLVTAYIPNRATGESLPGVGLIRSIGPYIVLFEKLKKKPTTADSDSQVSEKDNK